MHSTTNYNRILQCLITITIVVTAVGLCFPITSASFSPWYGSIAKNIALTNNWSDLVLSNHDWLDKPHFPFWATALSFKVFGINSFAYVLPGFLFHLIGALYTYKLTKFLYQDKTTALVASLIYLSVLHLMLSAIDVRAEAYLLGQIMPAVYYWLRYDQKFSLKYLFLGALFTALALMTKGIFVIITIISGLVCLWVYSKRLWNLVHPKWLVALALSMLMTTPELIALYLQFDAHPEKIIFGHTQVSGIRWFFIDSQFGRFFGTGPIVTTNPPPLHQLFFIHTFLWAFLPWSLVFPVAIYSALRQFRHQARQLRQNSILLLGYFFISFIMFSLTSFQVDHYTNIIFPFAAILCAKFLVDSATTAPKIYRVQQWLSSLILIITASLVGMLFHGWILAIFVILEVILVLILVRHWGQTPFIKALLLSVSAICLLFVVAMTINGYLYHKYDSGYLAAQVSNAQPQIPVVDYLFDSRALEFYSHNHYYKINDLNQVTDLPQFYLVLPAPEWAKIRTNYPQAELISAVQGNLPEKIIPHLANVQQLTNNLATIDIILMKRP